MKPLLLACIIFILSFDCKAQFAISMDNDSAKFDCSFSIGITIVLAGKPLSDVVRYTESGYDSLVVGIREWNRNCKENYDYDVVIDNDEVVFELTFQQFRNILFPVKESNKIRPRYTPTPQIKMK